MFEITTIIAIASSFFITIIGSWYLSRDRNLRDSFMVMDMSITALVLFFVLGRVFGLIIFDIDLPQQWSLLPITQSGSRVALLDFWPWISFAVNDGRFFLIDSFAAFFIAEIGFRVFSGRRVSLQKLTQPKNAAFGIYMLALLPIFVNAYVNDYLANLFDPSIVLTMIVIISIAAIGTIYFHKDNTKPAFLRVGLQLFFLVFMNMSYEGEHSLIFVNIILGVLFVLNLLKTLLELVVLTPTKTFERQAPEVNLRRHNFSYQTNPDAQNQGYGARSR